MKRKYSKTKQAKTRNPNKKKPKKVVSFRLDNPRRRVGLID